MNFNGEKKKYHMQVCHMIGQKGRNKDKRNQDFNPPTPFMYLFKQMFNLLSFVWLNKDI